MFYLLGAVFLGWALGANDAANIFGTAVASRMVRFARAAILCAVFVIIGAVLQGSRGMHTLSSLTSQDLTSAMLISVASAVTVTVLTVMKLPVSTSQAVVGAIIGKGLISGGVHWAVLGKIAACWIGTPLVAIPVACILYSVTAVVIRIGKVSFIRMDGYLRWGLIAAGCYGAYALGANNVANVTGVFSGVVPVSDTALGLLGGLSIGFGVITYSKNVMMTVGKGIVKLDAYSAMIVVLSQAVVVHICAVVGVPVSTSQAVVGAVLGIGLLKGLHTINRGTLLRVLFGWVCTPFLAGIISYLAMMLFA